MIERDTLRWCNYKSGREAKTCNDGANHMAGLHCPESIVNIVGKLSSCVRHSFLTKQLIERVVARNRLRLFPTFAGYP